jgi:serine protease inhibitor
MRRKKVERYTVILSLLVTMVVIMLVSPASLADRPHVQTVVEGNTAFALELYQELCSADGNLFLSPYSISTALAMTYGGARGDTAQQMAETLHFSLDQKQLHPAFAQLRAHLNAVQKKGLVRLHVANSLWPHKDYPFLKAYVALMKKYYGASITSVDYKTAGEEARTRINKWVEEETEEKIKDLIQPGVLTPLTRLVLVNAIYFKGSWARQFKGSLTQDAPFYLTPEKTVQAPFMTQEHTFRYGDDEGLQILELPYEGDDLAMLILLPTRVDGLAELEKALTPENLNQWITHLREQELEVFVPKFQLASSFSLNETLVSMGMRDAFNQSKANFAGMDGTTLLYISAAIHQAVVEVNEEGTEAAAATGIAMSLKAVPEPPPTFRADHPFIFLIRDNKTGSILFMGRVVDPTT